MLATQVAKVLNQTPGGKPCALVQGWVGLLTCPHDESTVHEFLCRVLCDDLYMPLEVLKHPAGGECFLGGGT